MILQDSEVHPILTIRLELTGSQVLFNPSLDDKSASSSVQESVEGWLNDFLGRGDSVRPLDEDLKVQYDLLGRFLRLMTLVFILYDICDKFQGGGGGGGRGRTINRNLAGGEGGYFDIPPNSQNLRLKSCAAISEKN